MISLSLQNDFPDVARRLARIPDAIKRDQATVMALNKVGAKARTSASRHIRQHYAMAVKDVNPRLRVTKGRRDSLTVILEPLPGSRGRTQNVIRFLEKKVSMAEAKRRRKAGTLSTTHYLRGGVARVNPILYFRIRKDGGSKRINGAFVGNKGRTVFRRTGRDRLPIEPIHTIDVPGMFSARKVMDAVLERIERELPVEMDRAIRLVLAKV